MTTPTPANTAVELIVTGVTANTVTQAGDGTLIPLDYRVELANANVELTLTMADPPRIGAWYDLILAEADETPTPPAAQQAGNELTKLTVEVIRAVGQRQPATATEVTRWINAQDTDIAAGPAELDEVLVALKALEAIGAVRSELGDRAPASDPFVWRLVR